MKILSFALVCCACLGFSQQDPADEMSIRHVTVVNVVTGAELPDQTVTIHGGRIGSLRPTQEQDSSLPGSFDAHGSFLVPGLWDMHVHIHGTGELLLDIANGVTGVRMMAGERDTSALRQQLARQAPSPEVYLASAIVDGNPPVWPGSIVVKKAEDARRAVDEIRASGADFIKVYDRVPRDAYFAIAEEAKQQHIPFAGHVPDAISAQEASAAGQRSIEHLSGVALACSNRQGTLMAEIPHLQFYRERLALDAQAYVSRDDKKCQALFSEFRSNETWQVPTLALLRVAGHLDDSHFLADSRLAYIDKRSRDRWEERTRFQRLNWNNMQYEMARKLFQVEQSVTGAMFRAGVPIMAGTDAMNPYCFPGFSLHDELALLVQSGVTPLAALQMATINPAKFLGRTPDIGSVEAGKIADLVLLEADPLADIRNTTRIEGVWLKGKYFDKATLANLLETVKAGIKK